MRHRAYILLGSNLGDPLEQLKRATELLAEHGDVVTKSAVYKTEPWGMVSTSWFYNQVLVYETDLSADALLQTLLRIERSMGRPEREEGVPYKDRIIDLDILYFDDEIAETNALTLPHPKVTERRFALAPMVEVAPSHLHPVLKRTQFELLKCCADKSFLELV